MCKDMEITQHQGNKPLVLAHRTKSKMNRPQWQGTFGKDKTKISWYQDTTLKGDYQ